MRGWTGLAPVILPKRLDIGVNLGTTQITARLENMKVKGKASIFVAFNDPTAKSLEPLRVETVLENMFEFVRDEAFAAFEPFF